REIEPQQAAARRVAMVLGDRVEVPEKEPREADREHGAVLHRGEVDAERRGAQRERGRRIALLATFELPRAGHLVREGRARDPRVLAPARERRLEILRLVVGRRRLVALLRAVALVAARNGAPREA